MALDITNEQRTVGKENFHRAVGKLAEDGVTRRQFMQGMIAAAGAGVAVPLAAATYFGYSNASFTDRPVRAGLIGAGDEGGVLVGEHNPEYVKFVAVADVRPSNIKRIFDGEPTGPRKGFNRIYGAEARKDIRVHDTWQKLLEDRDVEMVVIALPLHLHAKVAIAAMAAGKHVLTEKLMARYIGQCKQMIRAASQHDKLLAVGHQRHYSMLYAHATDVINSGALGDIRFIRALWHRANARPYLDKNGNQLFEELNGRRIPRYRDSWRKIFEETGAGGATTYVDVPTDDRRALESRIRELGYKDLNELLRWRLYERTGGGLMAELGSHQLDASSIFVGKKHPVSVSGHGGKNFYQDDREVADHVYCTFEFPGKNYDKNVSAYSPQGLAQYNDIITVTYSSINTQSYTWYGEQLQGTKGSLIVDKEAEVLLYGGGTAGDPLGRNTAVTVTATGGGPVLSASASDAPVERRAAAVGAGSLGYDLPSKGYKEEMEHFAYCIRMRDEGMARDRADLKPRCDGTAAMADAIIALTANIAMRKGERIVFQEKWFDPQAPEVPEDLVPDLRGLADRDPEQLS